MDADRVDVAADVLFEAAGNGHLGRLDRDPATGERRLVYVVRGRDVELFLGTVERVRRRGRFRRALERARREAAR